MVTKLGEVVAVADWEARARELVRSRATLPELTQEEIEEREKRRQEEQREIEKYEEGQRRYKRSEHIKRFRCTDAMSESLIAGTYGVTDAVTRARTWVENRDKPWLLLSGPTGCGKTMAAASIAAERGYADFVRADELVRVFSSMFGDQYERQQELRDARLLVIDDLGCELDHTRMLPALLDLLDARQSARRHPTVVTTNLTPAAFRERYANDRLNSRMAELVRWEGLTGDDLRRKR
jgi:DNA replication protein DnaC